MSKETNPQNYNGFHFFASLTRCRIYNHELRTDWRYLHFLKTCAVPVFFGFAFLLLLGQTAGLTRSDFNHKYSNNTIFSDQILNPASVEVSNNQRNDIELVGNVTKVVDGDTLDIKGIRIRLALVDTPEIGQLGYDTAKHFVESLCYGKKGEVDVDNGQRRGNRYGREVGVVYCDGVNVNDKLMANKMARILVEFCDITEFSSENWTATQCQGSR